LFFVEYDFNLTAHISSTELLALEAENYLTQMDEMGGNISFQNLNQVRTSSFLHMSNHRNQYLRIKENFGFSG
jgi:hypothetical protein